MRDASVCASASSAINISVRQTQIGIDFVYIYGQRRNVFISFAYTFAIYNQSLDPSTEMRSTDTLSPQPAQSAPDVSVCLCMRIGIQDTHQNGKIPYSDGIWLIVALSQCNWIEICNNTVHEQRARTAIIAGTTIGQMHIHTTSHTYLRTQMCACSSAQTHNANSLRHLNNNNNFVCVHSNRLLL